MLARQMREDLRNATWPWEKPVAHFTGSLGGTMEARFHYQSRLKVLHAFTLLHSMRAGSMARTRAEFCGLSVARSSASV
jgi:hypothetical protein